MEIINPLEAKTRIATSLRADYVLKALIVHYGGFGTSKGLYSIVGVDVTVIAPKVLHDSIRQERPGAVVVTPQSCAKNPLKAETVLWLFAVSNHLGTVSAVLARKKVTNKKLIEFVCRGCGDRLEIYTSDDTVQLCDDCKFWADNSIHLGWVDGEPCSHPGCLQHVTHPCEGCGRVAGRKAE